MIRQRSSELKRTHAAIFALQDEMKNDSQFRSLCVKHGLPWDFAAGYEPRWYNGPAPEQCRVLFMMAEPGAITPTEAHNLRPAINQKPWIGPHDLRLQENYWLANLRQLCAYVWPNDTEDNMYAHLGGTCAFWMSLPAGRQNAEVPSHVLDYFLTTYLKRLVALFPKRHRLGSRRQGQRSPRPGRRHFRKLLGFHSSRVQPAGGSGQLAHHRARNRAEARCQSLIAN